VSTDLDRSDPAALAGVDLMPAPSSRKAVAATILIILGIGLAALALLAHGSERLSYGGSQPSQYVHLTAGRTYTLAVPGGIKAMNDKGIEQASIPCAMTFADGRPSQNLELTAESADSRAINVFARFTSAVTAQVHIECADLGTVFVDDADDAPHDLAFLYLTLCAIALTVGAGLLMSLLRHTPHPRRDAVAVPVGY